MKSLANQSDIFRDELRALIVRYAPDYVAPALNAALVQTAIKIGLTERVVIEQITRGFEMHRRCGKRSP